MTADHDRPRAPPQTEPARPTDADRLRERIRAAGLSQRAAARELGIDERTMRYWCAGQHPPPEMAYRALDPRARHYEHLNRTIRSNEEQIELLESGRMMIGSGPVAGSASAAAAEAGRLRRANEELEVLLRLEDAFQRRQAAFFAVHSQFLPHGNGLPSEDSITEFEAAETSWRAAQRDADLIVEEIRTGLR